MIEKLRMWSMRHEKGGIEAPLGNCVKARILADLAQIITDFGDIEEVMAELSFAMQQNRHEFPPFAFERLVGIDVEYLDVNAEFGCDRRQSGFQIVAKVAVGARQQREFCYAITFHR